MTNILVTTIWNLCGVIGGPKPLGDGLEADDGTDGIQIHLSCKFSADVPALVTLNTNTTLFPTAHIVIRRSSIWIHMFRK